MNNTTSIFVLLFLAITFIMSVHEKIFHWQDTLSFLKTHFEKTVLKKQVSIITSILVVFELLAGLFCIVGIIQLLVNNGRLFGFLGAIFSCISFLFMLIGQRLAKDYDGARTIAIYYILACLAVFLLG
jgi:uncharacterized membrane protein YphA (DoxX/SURF4 family)